jgi:LPS sulfotransferase NodH/glycosyltransferase involved in cell wall biosynthesis
VRLSCCIVARNEAALIGACIESARPAVDEVVLVDTGSTDGTPELAARAGARVIQAAWPGDLGQAHDLPVAHARGDWVLVLDGDEVLDSVAAPALRGYAASGRYEGYRLPIRNYSYLPMVKWRRADPGDPLARGALGYMPSSPVRLFRHGRGYRHQGFLHQTVAPSIRAAGGRIGTAAVPIHHYGYLRVEAPKRSLYVALALRQATATPRSARAWIDLGQPLLQARRLPAAAAAFRRAHILGGGASASYWLGETLLHMGRPASALRYLHQAVARNARDQALDFERADAWEQIARAEEALGRPRAAAAAYRRALALRPDSPVALNDLAGLLAERGATRQAEALVRELLRHYRGLDMAWATLGTLRVRQGELGEARRAFARALDIEPRSRPARVNLAACRALAAGRTPRATLAEDQDRPLALHRLGRGGVLSVAALLGGGGGRVLVDVVRALRGRPQHVVCFEEAATTEGLGAELARLGVGLVTLASEHGLRAVIRRLQPETVIFHGWPNRTVPEVVRCAGERWIAVGHNVVPMPLGADDHVVISDFHASRQRHLPAARVRHIPNGVELARFGRRPRPGRRPVTIVMLSRLDPAKFARRLLDYLPPLEALGARLLIAGRGARRAEIEPEIAERGLGRVVRFVGPIPHHEVPGFLAAADIGLHLTETAEEACSLALLEMLASGLPIVAEPKGCVSEMVRPGENGFLSLEPKQVAADLERLILSPALRRRLGAASRRRARRWSMARFRRAWRSLVDGPRPAPAPAPVAPRRYAPWRPSLAVLVCGTPRSGSGLLCEALWNTGLVGHPDDFFEPETVRGLAARWGEPAAGRYLELAMEEGSSPNGVFTARLSLAGLHTLRELLAAAPGALPPTRYVWIVRRDRVGQAISWERAEQAGTWAHLAGERRLVVPRPRFAASAIAHRLAEIERQEAAWRAWFEAAGATPIRVAYEDLAADYEGTARRMARALAIEVPAALPMGQRTLVAMADRTTEQWVRRFERR